MPCSLTSLAARGGWLYPYRDLSSSVVIKPCYKICSITVRGRFDLTAFRRLRNSFGMCLETMLRQQMELLWRDGQMTFADGAETFD